MVLIVQLELNLYPLHKTNNFNNNSHTDILVSN